MIKFFGYKNCSSCRNAEKFLNSHGVAYAFIDITQNPPSASELKGMIEKSGLETKKFLNTSGEVYREMGLKDKLKAMSDGDIIKLLASNGRLIKRPLISDSKTTTVGFKDDVMEVWT